MRPLIGITTHRRDSDVGQQDLLALMPQYVDSVRHNGGLPVLVPLGLADDELHDLFERLDGLVISGGGDMQADLAGADAHPSIYGIDPDRDRIELNLIRWAVDDEKPFLGICRGAQVMNVALGGTLYGDIAAHAPNKPLKHNWFPGFPRNLLAHPIAVTEETRLAEILGAPLMEVNSLHHQAIKEAGPKVEVAAHAPDGIIEAIEVPGHKFALGVQWHPEWLQDQPAMRALFMELVKAAS